MTDFHSDNDAHATEILLQHNRNKHAESYAYGTIGPDNKHDNDWFKVNLIAGNKYEIKLTGGNSREPHKLNLGQISVYTKNSQHRGPDYTEIYQSNNTKKRGRVRVNEIIQSQDYWIKIEGIETNSFSEGIGSYSIKVEQYGKIAKHHFHNPPTEAHDPYDFEPTTPTSRSPKRPTHTYKNFSITTKRFIRKNILTGPTRYGDTVKGTNRSDTLQDGYGPDILIGGKGRNSFYVSAPDGFGENKADSISDFGNKDRIVLSNLLFDPRQKVIFSRALSRDKEAMSELDFDVIYFEDTGELFLDSNGSRPGFGGRLDGGLMLTVEPLTNISRRNIIIES